MRVVPARIAAFLQSAPPLPALSNDELQARAECRKLSAEDPHSLFPDSPHPEAALAALLLRLQCWSESHKVVQDLASPEGSYWHGILHRIEGDSFNAGYWFKRVGVHPVFPDLYRRATEILTGGGPQHWRLKNSWDPDLFTKWCDEARATGGNARQTALDIQHAEWQLLFDWCAGVR